MTMVLDLTEYQDILKILDYPSPMRDDFVLTDNGGVNTSPKKTASDHALVWQYVQLVDAETQTFVLQDGLSLGETRAGAKSVSKTPFSSENMDMLTKQTPVLVPQISGRKLWTPPAEDSKTCPGSMVFDTEIVNCGDDKDETDAEATYDSYVSNIPFFFLQLYSLSGIMYAKFDRREKWSFTDKRFVYHRDIVVEFSLIV